MEIHGPFISVVICTRDRAHEVVRAVTSVLRNDYPAYELLVVDQSQADETARLLAELPEDSRLRSIRSSESGLARARNMGIQESVGEVIAFCDDDCTVPGTWLDRIATVFAAGGAAQLVFGNVAAAPHDASAGFIPTYERRAPFTAHSLKEKHLTDGIGACMAVSRSAAEALGGFDPRLGAGASLRSAEENDFAVRALLAGYWILEAPAIHVLHHGLRSWEEQDGLIFDYLYGTGAMFAKHLRLWHLGVLPLLGRVFWRWAFGKPLVGYIDSPRRLMRLSAFCRGLGAGGGMPLDRETGLFTEADPGRRTG